MIIVFSYYVLLQSFLLINIFHSCSNMPQQIIFSSPKEPARYSFLAQRSSIRMKTLVQLPNLGVIRKIFINEYFTQLQQYATTNHLQLAKMSSQISNAGPNTQLNSGRKLETLSGRKLILWHFIYPCLYIISIFHFKPPSPQVGRGFISF